MKENMSEKNLIDILKSRTEGPKLANRLDDIRLKAIPLLKKIGETFPQYTLHDVTHSENIITNLNLLIPDILKEKLNIYEIYFLVAGAYLHDIGMVNFPKLIEENEIGKKEDLVECIRDTHHIRSEKFIIENYKDLMIDDPHQATIIGSICRGHRKENLNNMDLFDPSLIYIKCPINIALLSSLLRIADELDLTFERAPLIVYEHVPPRNEISNDEWQKHLKITGVAKHPEDSLIIKCSAICENSNIHRALRNLEIKINNELDNLVEHLHQYRDCRKEVPRKFIIDIKSINYKYHDFRFSLQEKEIINLLMGEKLYNNKAESLRELLKNSVDACRFRKDELMKQGLNYEPKITFNSVPDEHKIIVEDNGMGMDEYIIESHFTKIGRSFYRSEQFLKNIHNFEPVGELGIGVLSYFMIADKVTIETTTDVDGSLIIEIDNVSDYFFVKQGNKKSPGTVVTLDLNRDFGYKSLAELIRTYATHVEFPIEVFDSDGEKYIIEDRINFPLELAEKYYEVLPVKIECFSGSLGVFANKRIEHPFEINPFNIGRVKKLEQNYVSSEGILVSNDDTTNSLLPSWINPNLVVFDIDLKKEDIDLNVARNKIIDNEKLAKFKKVFEEELINALIDLVGKIKARSDTDYPKMIYSFFKYYIRNKTDRSYNRNMLNVELSENFIKFARRFCFFKCFTEEGMFFLNYEEITRKNVPIVLLRDLNDDDDEYLLGIFEDAHEKGVLIADEKDRSIIYLANILFNIKSKDFSEIFGETSIRSTKLNSIFSDLHDNMGILYSMFRPQSYWTTRFIEYANDEEVIFNENNNFINLIITNDASLADEISIFSLKEFFSSLTNDNNYDRIFNKQKAILALFVLKNIIEKNDVSKYELKPSDFPPSFSNISFAIYL
jgi:hypothetical protein